MLRPETNHTFIIPALTPAPSLARKKGKDIKLSHKKSFFEILSNQPEIPNLSLSASINRRGMHDIFLITPEMARARQRREKNRSKPPEEVASTAEEDRHDIPAAIASQAIHIETPLGNGWMPVESSIDLENGDLSQVEEIFFVQHGIKRNVKDYFEYMKNAIETSGRKFDPKKTLIISTQFTNEIDLQGKENLWQDRYNRGEGVNPNRVLHWGFNDWRGAEPAQNPTAPIDSFTAMDAIIEHILDTTEKAGANVNSLRFRGNSEGAQFLDRYMAYSKVLKKLEKDKIYSNGAWKHKMEIEAFVSNPGTLHYFHTIRPDLILRYDNYIQWHYDWIEFPEDSDVNLWPFGLYDPPPYIIDYLNEYSPEVACDDYMRRVTLGVGTADNELGGSQLPMGPGLAYVAQGLTRLERVDGKHHYLLMLDTKYNLHPQILYASDFLHDGRAMFEYFEKVRVIREFHIASEARDMT